MSPPVPRDTLRDALEREAVQEVLDELPDTDTCERGLCVDTSPADTIRVEGHTRMSLLRIYSKAHGTEKLVGQIQILAESAKRETWSLRFYAHDQQFPSTEEYDDRQRWWDAVEDLHTKLTGLRP